MESLETRFWANVQHGDGCWEWQAARTTDGYGRFGAYAKTYRAHRFAWQLAYGACPLPKIDVCHRCDNRLCIRPDHLFLGTRLDNMRDCYAKNRGNQREQHPASRLSSEQVQAIRDAYATGTITQARLAMQFGMSRQHISAIIRNRFWKV